MGSVGPDPRRRRRLIRLIALSIAAAIATIALKVFAWLLTDSVGLLSDAAESLVNLVAALIAPGGLASRLSTETVAVEVVRALAGTAGVLLAMPLATASALLIGVGEE